MIGVSLSKGYSAKMSRIKRLPEKYSDMVIGAVKKDAIQLITNFHDGIQQNKFRLDKLATLTKASKKRDGMAHPNTPLYGKGNEAKDRSYMNMLRLKRLSNGWKIYPSWAKHWSGNITLRHLLKIHELGCTIKRGDTMIKIPPRPAFLKAYKKLMTDKIKNKKETSKEVKTAIMSYINDANKKYIDDLIKAGKYFEAKYRE